MRSLPPLNATISLIYKTFETTWKWSPNNTDVSFFFLSCFKLFLLFTSFIQNILDLHMIPYIDSTLLTSFAIAGLCTFILVAYLRRQDNSQSTSSPFLNILWSLLNHWISLLKV